MLYFFTLSFIFNPNICQLLLWLGCFNWSPCQYILYCDPELFSHSAYVKFVVTFATKVPYLTFCDKMRQFLIKEMEREGGNKEKMRKCRE